MAEQSRLLSPAWSPECLDVRPRCASDVSVASVVLEAQDQHPLFKGDILYELPCNVCEKVVRDLGETMVKSIQLDPETVASLVTFQIINDGEQLRNASKSESERVMDYLCPAVRRGGNRALERLYQVLMHTREGRIGHKELARRIERKAHKYVSRYQAKKQSPRHSPMDANSYLKGLQLYQHHLCDKLDFNLFGLAAEETGFFQGAESKRLTQLWQEDKEKAVCTLIEATEAKGTVGLRMLLNTLKHTLGEKEMDVATRECHQGLLDELSQLEQIDSTGIPPSHSTASNGVVAGCTYVSDGVAGNLGQEQIDLTTEVNVGPHVMLLEKEAQIARLREQIRMLTDKVKELKSTLQKREGEQSTLTGVLSEYKDRESALNQDIADLNDKVASLESRLGDSEEGCSCSGCSEQLLTKTKEESKRFKAALNTCRKRIKSLESSSADFALPEHDPPSVEGLKDVVKDLCASVKVAYISEGVSQQRQKMMYFSLKDSLCQALKAVEQRLKDV